MVPPALHSDHAPQLGPQLAGSFQNDLAALFAWRRDVRHFRDTTISEDVVADLLKAAQTAPSVGHSQPWRFVRVRSSHLRAELSAHADDEARKAGSAMPEGEPQATYAKLKLHAIDHAPEIIAVFCDDKTPIGGGLGAATMPQTREWSVVLAIHTLWLTAQAHGLGVGWVSIVRPEVVSALVNAPAGWRFIALLCLGEPEHADTIPELERRGWQPRLDWSAHVSEC